MQVRGLLMKEHRVIEKMILFIRRKLNDELFLASRMDADFISTSVDFIRSYADYTHHGKEEHILFRALSEKTLSDDDQKIMNDLIDEHVYGRQVTSQLNAANQRYKQGDDSAVEEIVRCLKILIEFYPQHIVKEDDIFFPRARKYFSDEEEQALVEECLQFDQRAIHEKYRIMLDSLDTVVTEALA